MLEPAWFNQQKLKELYSRAIIKKINKFFISNNSINYDLFIDQSEERRIQYISKDKDGNILMYMGASLNRHYKIVENIEIINLSDIFSFYAGKDLVNFINILFFKKDFRKIMFGVATGNPAYKSFRKLILKSDLGQIVGILKDHYMTQDGVYYDMVLMEMYRENFRKSVHFNPNV
jgi:hypothetical protein